jgi:hypothetical protein
MGEVHIFRTWNKKVTNIFKDTDIKIAYKPINTTRKQRNYNEYDNRDVFGLSCMDCP